MWFPWNWRRFLQTVISLILRKSSVMCGWTCMLQEHDTHRQTEPLPISGRKMMSTFSSDTAPLPLGGVSVAPSTGQTSTLHLIQMHKFCWGQCHCWYLDPTEGSPTAPRCHINTCHSQVYGVSQHNLRIKEEVPEPSKTTCSRRLVWMSPNNQKQTLWSQILKPSW